MNSKSINFYSLLSFIFFTFTQSVFICADEVSQQDIVVQSDQLDEQAEDTFALDEDDTEEEKENIESEKKQLPGAALAAVQPQRINQIILTRHHKNKYLTDESILTRIPYQKGNVFDARKTSALIHALYDIKKPYGFFEQIYVLKENLADDLMNLHVIIYEKPELEEIIIVGNKKVKSDEIDEKLNLGDIEAINEVDLQRIIRDLRKIYREHNYQLVKIEPSIQKTDNKASVVITVDEGIKSLVKRIHFVGNCAIKSKHLKNVLLTKEDWLFGFFNNAGTYQPDMLEIDKQLIESYYKSHGYLMAKVTDAQVKLDECTKQYSITFTVNEGDCYIISEVHAPGQDILSEELILAQLPIKKGDLYSDKNMRDAIEQLRSLWGVYGYVFADVDPQVVPDVNNKTVSITFNTELGDKVYINRINVIGNTKTQDCVIRRRLSMEEGDLLTSSEMDRSKARVENLGYFDPNNGVNWKINRLDEDLADLDLMVKEVKTGKIAGEMGFGGSQFNLSSVSSSFRFGGSISDINVMGTGILVRAGGSWSKEEWTVGANVADQWFLNKPILAEADFHITNADYSQELHNVKPFTERITAGFVGSGFTLARTFLHDSALSVRIGGESIKNSCRVEVDDMSVPGARILQLLLDRRFQSGDFAFIAFGIAQDFRNHTLHPSGGYQWALTTRIGASATPDGLGFAKLDLDASWFTPLIGQNLLVFGLHGHVGIVGALKNKNIPYRELYHIGGPATVRGYLYGQIGPTFMGDSLGATKAFYLNAELVFPITQDFSLKGAFFYDGGAGWNTPGVEQIPDNRLDLLKNNQFNFRQAIGFGVRMLRPQPIKIDVGFKLDKRKNENTVEVHFSSYRDF